jgi:hypothetical protein
MVVQAYWNKDQDCKFAKAQRERLHDLALLAVPKGGASKEPAKDADGMAHWLSHGEKETVVIDPRVLARLSSLSTPELLELMNVNTALLKEREPALYAYMLKHKSTVRTTHDVLTWADKKPTRRVRS